MIYTGLIKKLSPVAYVPMSVGTPGSIVDVISGTQSNLVGSATRETINSQLNKGIRLSADSYFTLESASSFPATGTVSFWANATEQTGLIGEVFGNQFSKIGGVLEHTDDTTGGTIASPQPDSDIIMITVSYSPSETKIYINSDTVLDLAYGSTPSQYIYFGAISDAPGSSPNAYSDIFVLNYRISDSQVQNLYSVGVNGYETVSIDSSSNINLSDSDPELLQTSWQAYGIVMVKA
jgi:hypothetical protein